MTDATIIEAMEAEWRKVYPNAPAHTLEDGMRALLAICAPAIRAQAMEEAAVKAWIIGMEAHMRQPWATDSREVGSRIAENLRALALPAVAGKGERDDPAYTPNPAGIATTWFGSECRCENPAIKCDNTGCRCMRCGQPERVRLPSRPAAPAQSTGESEPVHVRNRWNIEEDGDDLLICFNQHDKGEKCDYVRYVQANRAPAPSGVETVQIIESARKLFRSCAKGMVSEDYATGYEEALDHIEAALASKGESE